MHSVPDEVGTASNTLSAMQGAEVLSEAKTAVGSYDSYKKVADHLKQKCDQPKVVYHHHGTKISMTNWKAWSQSFQRLKLRNLLPNTHTLSISLHGELEALQQASQAWTLGARIKNTVLALSKAPYLNWPSLWCHV